MEMDSRTAAPRDCSVARTLEVIGEKWALLALREVFFGVRRFDAIQRKLMQWGDRHLTQGMPPTTFRHRCGADLDPVLVCRACGEPVRNRELSVVPSAEPAAPDDDLAPDAALPFGA